MLNLSCTLESPGELLKIPILWPHGLKLNLTLLRKGPSITLTQSNSKHAAKVEPQVYKDQSEKGNKPRKEMITQK
jgi:hypothetical protein